ncbi:hypothetical protein FZC84_15080 [Rossellomorea vietnamensis]|uniref:DUF4871 domain-containing protein n=1 Tax=Rossellomorea vietnamensis TaxID=218284 RepID=A0A5D4MB40_9BACI|nr:hypothetical protein [Rossellomorea vietnamensis]TYR98235.1 hypothetical protein FZC84_15080 [Rossellomorea vietnamensis]
MNDKLENLKKAMDATTHEGSHFTESQKQRVRSAIHSDERNLAPKPAGFMIFSLSAAAIAIMLLLFSTHVMPNLDDNQSSNPAASKDWEISDQFVQNHKEKFRVFPEQGLTAGKPSGYLFSFQEPFDVYKGKELTIDALNKETSEKISVVSKIIKEPSPGYSSLQRFTANFEIPYGGLWKYEVKLNGEYYGDVVLSVNEEIGIEMPEDIPEFVKKEDLETIDWNRKAVNFDRGIIGNENKSGVIGMDMPSLTPQKWMWHLWGNKSSEFTVAGFHRGSQTVHPILDNGWKWTMQLGSAVNGADAHVPSSVTIPKGGEWAFLLYDGDKLFDVLVYEIEK